VDRRLTFKVIELAPSRVTYPWDSAMPWCIDRHPDPAVLKRNRGRRATRHDQDQSG